MSDEPVRLAPRLEELLQALPTPERNDWDALAGQIDQRVRETEAKSTAPLWLMAPLPDEPHEPGARAESQEPAADATSNEEPRPAPASSRPGALTPSPPATSLAALARAVAQKGARPEAAHIAKESISLAAAARVHTEGMVERVRSARPPTRDTDARVPPAPPSARVAPAVAPVATQARRSELGPWIAIGGLGAALAAALMVIAFRREPAQIVVAAPPAAPVAAAATNAQAQPQAPAPAPAPTQASAPNEDSVRAEAANGPPTLAASSLPLATKNIASASGTHSSGEALAAANRSTSGSGTRPAPEKIQLEEAPAKSKPASETAAAPASSGMRPAAGSTTSGGLPDRPSTGAVQAAVGSVMSAARACVAGGAATPAQISFGSDGSVSSVTVSGPAAGTSAAKCIEAALKRARVAPFTNPSFSLGIWVRP